MGKHPTEDTIRTDRRDIGPRGYAIFLVNCSMGSERSG